MTTHVIVEADGGSRGNPGPAGYGAVVLDAATRAVLTERSEPIGVETNNVAEYRGLIAGLTAAQEIGATHVSVRMDSKLVVEQMSGRWQVKHPAMRPLAREAAELRRGFDDVTFEWIPRERNKHADRLANEAMDRAAGKSPKSPKSPKFPKSVESPGAARSPWAATAAEPSGAAGSPSAGAPNWVPQTGTRTRLHLVRHGSTEHSLARRFSGRNELPLNAVGIEQAAALARRRFGDVAAVVTSPLRRAVQTAEAVAGPLGLRVTTVDELAELDFGQFEGLTMAEAREAHPAALSAWLASPDAAPPGGESFAALGRRVRRGREAVVAAHPGETVVIVTHVTPIKTLVRFALDAPPSAMFRIHLDTASVSTIDYFADATSSLRLFNDTSHLPAEP